MKYCAFLLLLVVAPFAEAQPDDSSAKPPDTVQIGTYIISIHDINFQQKEYTIRFWLWLIYQNLQFDFAKQIDIPNAKTIEEPEVLMDMVDGKMWQLMKMKCVMKQNWKVGDFPFDKQRLVVHIENSIYDQNQLVFVADEFGSTFDRELTLDGWRIRDFKVNTNTHEYITVFGDPRSDMMHSEYASFNIVIDIERDAWGLFLKIFIGMYIAFLIAALSFTPKATELEPRYGLPVGGLFAAVGNKYIIDSLLPESSSFTLVDTLHTITFLGIFVTLLISAIALRLYEKDKKEASARVDYWGSRIVIVLYVVLNIVFVWLAEK
ncbi:MAG: hypothetical protein HRU69_07655 [Flammeovirgaceae bacterium]|nr:MAG: hypothetical protein HRU69_07655 [Flammeovirgaceae bacterium]